MLLRNWGLTALAILAIPMANGCRPTTSRVSRANLTAIVGPRTIKAVVDNPAFIAPKENSAVITFGTHAISVESDQVPLDGKKVADIPPDSKLVSVNVDDGVLTVTADDVQPTTVSVK